MQTGETRTAKQCTYSRLSLDSDGGAVVKNALLSLSVDARLADTVLSGLDGDAPMVRAATALFAGDAVGSARELAAVPLADVVGFAERALDAEQALLSEAVTAITAALPPDGSGESVRVQTSAGKVLVAEAPAVVVVQPGATTHASVVADAPAVPVSVPDWSAVATAAPKAHAIAQALGCAPATALAVDTATRCIKAQIDAGERRRRRLHALARTVRPIGLLQLERLKFTPLEYIRGELVYSLPLLPGEVVRLTHREWSRSETEFTKLVATSLETAAEETLSEKSELTESFQTQEQHTAALNASASGSGAIGPITSFTASVSGSIADAEQETRETSARRAREVTRTASSRAKQEMKITFKVATVFEVEDTSFREIRNDSDRPVRWDYHRMLKRWRVDLYRYDARLTYDLVVPEPGSYLLRRHAELRGLRAVRNRERELGVSPRGITRENWMRLADQHGAVLEPPPRAVVYAYAHGEKPFTSRIVGYDYLELVLPDGYEFEDWGADGANFTVEGGFLQGPGRAGYIDPMISENSGVLRGGAAQGNRYLWRYYYDWSEPREAERGSVLSVSAWARGRVSDRTFAAWQMEAWQRLDQASQERFERDQQAVARRIEALEAELQDEDSLSLRRLEKEELMKATLRWMLGPGFAFYPHELPQLTPARGDVDVELYVEGGQSIAPGVQEPILQHGELVRFLHQAVEWENVTYVLYPYFWTDDARWADKQPLKHPDATHEAFLRAGAARVVLPLRRGFEDQFLAYTQTLDPSASLPAGHPYVTVADELRQVAQTQYPYTPGAHAEREENRVATWFEFTPTGALDVTQGTALIDVAAADEDEAAPAEH